MRWVGKGGGEKEREHRALRSERSLSGLNATRAFAKRRKSNHSTEAERETKRRYKCTPAKNVKWARSRQKPIINSVTSRCPTRQLLLFQSHFLFKVTSLFLSHLFSMFSSSSLSSVSRNSFNRSSIFFATNFYIASKRNIMQFAIKLSDSQNNR